MAAGNTTQDRFRPRGEARRGPPAGRPTERGHDATARNERRPAPPFRAAPPGAHRDSPTERSRERPPGDQATLTQACRKQSNASFVMVKRLFLLFMTNVVIGLNVYE